MKTNSLFKILPVRRLVRRSFSNAGSFSQVLLSATLFNLAFFFPNQLGFLILFSFIPIFLMVRDAVLCAAPHHERKEKAVRPDPLTSSSLRHGLVGQAGRAHFNNFFQRHVANLSLVLSLSKDSSGHGLLWGVLVFAPQLIWLYQLLLTKTPASFFLATIIYLFFVFYYSLISALWFGLTALLVNYFARLKLLLFTLTTTIYFLFIIKYSLWFLGRAEGYPLINPIIPLAKYKWFLFACGLFFGRGGAENSALKDCKVFYLAPVIKTSEKLPASAVGQKIYHQLANLNLEKYEKIYKHLIIVAPETFYPFSLNEQLELVEFWNCALPNNAHFFLGSQRAGECDKTYQTVYWLKGGRIIDFYDKKHAVAFAEEIPSNFKEFNWARSLFLKNKVEFTKGEDNVKNDFFKVEDNFIVVPRICSELFFLDNSLEGIPKGERAVLFFFVNDSWFTGYFRELMQNYARIKSFQYEIPVFYINHAI